MTPSVFLGGTFLYANDPSKLAAWYSEHLGLVFQHDPQSGSYWQDFHVHDIGEPDREQQIVFAIHAAKATSPPQRNQCVVNWRVSNLDDAMKRLIAGGVTIERQEDYPYGRFCWCQDAEGNALEIWQPV